ncbi:MAG: hypothetical protein KGL54_07040, partial [Sphingomonadales bacterium]|nr:hypothetical protein [Sphingomonadales bacterium]
AGPLSGFVRGPVERPFSRYCSRSGAMTGAGGRRKVHPMNRFMFARSDGVACMWSQSGPDEPEDIMERLAECLAALDRLGAAVPAVHLATAIEHLRAQYGLPDVRSNSD